MAEHEHKFPRPMRLNFVKGYEGPVDIYDCACGYRRIVRRGGSPRTDPDPREIHYSELQDWNELDTIDNTGGGIVSPALWLTQAKEGRNG